MSISIKCKPAICSTLDLMDFIGNGFGILMRDTRVRNDYKNGWIISYNHKTLRAKISPVLNGIIAECIPNLPETMSIKEVYNSFISDKEDLDNHMMKYYLGVSRFPSSTSIKGLDISRCFEKLPDISDGKE